MRRLFSRLLLLPLILNHARASWPPSVPSSVELLGLFKDDWNSSLSARASVQCRAMFNAAMSLAEAYNITVDGRPIGWRVAPTHDDVVTTMGYACLAVSTTNIVGIIGPRLSHEAHVISRFAQRIGIPVVSYSATDPDLSDRQTHPAFYRTVPPDTSAAKAIAKLFERYNWTSGILIYQNDAYGSAGATVINDAFEQREMSIADTIVFDVAKRAIRGNLTSRLLNSATRVIVLWADPTFAANILQEAATKNLLGPRYLWILSVGIPLHSFEQSFSQALIGMLSVEPAPSNEINGSLLTAAYEMWKRYEPQSFPGENNVDPYALFAFDATWLLIQSLERICPDDTHDQPRPCLSLRNSSFCFDGELVNSTALLHQISTIKFLGVSGPIGFDANGVDRIRGIHYIARNARLSADGVTLLPALIYSEAGAWTSFAPVDDVLWPGRSFKVPSDRASIAGVKLRVGIIESRPFTMIEYMIDEHGQNKSYAVGYIPDLIDLLQHKMRFALEMVPAPSNQSYLGLVQAVANGDYDIFVGDVTVTSKRRELVAFSASIFDNSLRLIIRKPTEDQLDLFAYLRPFSIRLWMAILATTTFTSILVFLVERHSNEALRSRSILSMGAMSLWYSIGHIMGYGADFHVTTISGRLLTVALYILSLILVASYTANLGSNLTISKTKNIISSIEDIKHGKLPFNRIGVWVGTSAEDFFLREISEQSQNYYPLKSRQELIDRLLSGDIDASFIDSGVGEYITNSVYCNLTLVGPGFDARRLGIVAPKNWLYLEDFDRNVLALRESGRLDALRQRWFDSNVCRDSLETPNAMGVESMAGLFLTVGIIIFVALLMLIWTKRAIIKQRLCSFHRGHYNLRHDPDVVNNA